MSNRRKPPHGPPAGGSLRQPSPRSASTIVTAADGGQVIRHPDGTFERAGLAPLNPHHKVKKINGEFRLIDETPKAKPEPPNTTELPPGVNVITRFDGTRIAMYPNGLYVQLDRGLPLFDPACAKVRETRSRAERFVSDTRYDSRQLTAEGRAELKRGLEAMKELDAEEISGGDVRNLSREDANRSLAALGLKFRFGQGLVGDPVVGHGPQVQRRRVG